MKLSYEDYLMIDKKKLDLTDFIDFIIEGVTDIPVLGNTIKATSSKLSDIITERNSISDSLKKSDDSNYFVVLAEDFEEEIATKIFEILNIEKIQKKYRYDIKDIEFELSSTFNNAEPPIEEHYILIRFLDHQFFNSALNQDDYGAVIISFKEDFKQINFENHKVYICFKIIAAGSNTAIHKFSRPYDEFAQLICYLLNSKI